jgi:hypothetical protein
MEELNHPGTEILPYPLQRGVVRQVAIPAEAAGRADLLPLWAGQSARLSSSTDVATLLASLVKEVSSIARPVTAWSARHRPSPGAEQSVSYRTITVDGLSIFYREAGQKGAPTLLLLRGCPHPPGCSSRSSRGSPIAITSSR